MSHERLKYSSNGSNGNKSQHRSARSVKIKASNFDVDNFYDLLSTDRLLDQQLIDLERGNGKKSQSCGKYLPTDPDTNPQHNKSSTQADLQHSMQRASSFEAGKSAPGNKITIQVVNLTNVIAPHQSSHFLKRNKKKSVVM